MRRHTVVAAGLAIGLLGTAAPAGAVVHEIVAAYCSGGDHGVITPDGELVPPGLLSDAAFARPVVASGAVDVGTLTVTDHPAAKFPEGTSVFAATSDVSDHPSAEHCPGAEE